MSENTGPTCPAPGTGRPICDGTYNTDVVTLTTKLNRFIAEAYLSESASVHTVSDFDLVRFKSYLDQLYKTHGWIIDTPQVDNPSVYPRFNAIPVWDDVPQIESDNIRTLIRGLEICRDELIMSQSSRISSGLIPFDSIRLTANLDRTGALLNLSQDPSGTDYTATTPLVPVLSRNFSVAA